MKTNNLKSKALLLLLLMAAGVVKGQDYEKILKSDSTSWITCHLELEFKTEGHAYVNNRDSLLYYDAFGGSADYNCVGRLKEENGKLWITYTQHPFEEVLLLDMDLEVGDEFFVTPYHMAHVVEISYENGRKVIVFDFVSPFWGSEPLKFIEGVGRNYMVFEWYDDIDRNYQCCKYDGDELAYSTANPLFDGCRINNTSIEEPSKENGAVEIYPNPAHNEISICFADNQESHREISILNLLGMVMKTFPTTSSTTTMPIEDLRSGIYVIKIVHQNRVLTEKLVIN